MIVALAHCKQQALLHCCCREGEVTACEAQQDDAREGSEKGSDTQVDAYTAAGGGGGGGDAIPAAAFACIDASAGVLLPSMIHWS